MKDNPCQFCSSTGLTLVFDYTSRPEGETRFPFLEGKAYHRQVLRCEGCGHFTSVCEMDISDLYNDEYVNATYQDEDGVQRTFERIINLPAEKSDNAGRVERVNRFARGFLDGEIEHKLLDIGTGLAVFPWAMKQRGWNCTALDPDPRTAEHARTIAGVKAICADFLKEPLTERFPLVTLNKVLEHVPDPTSMLKRAGKLLEGRGLIYIEIPDGEAASDEGAGREEFFIEHLHVFSSASVALMAHKAGLRLLSLERYREPSSKYTISAFCTKNGYE